MRQDDLTVIYRINADWRLITLQGTEEGVIGLESRAPNGDAVSVVEYGCSSKFIGILRAGIYRAERQGWADITDILDNSDNKEEMFRHWMKANSVCYREKIEE